MSAKEAFKLASEQWVTLPTEKIFEEIYNSASKGYRSAHISGSGIEENQLLLLQELGYKVEVYGDS